MSFLELIATLLTAVGILGYFNHRVLRLPDTIGITVMGVLVSLIRTLREALGLTTVIVSHDIHETLSIADHIYVIADGKVIGSGSPDELRRSDSPFVQQFLNGSPDGPVRFHYPAPSYRDDIAAAGSSKKGGQA